MLAHTDLYLKDYEWAKMFSASGIKVQVSDINENKRLVLKVLDHNLRLTRWMKDQQIFDSVVHEIQTMGLYEDDISQEYHLIMRKIDGLKSPPRGKVELRYLLDCKVRAIYYSILAGI